MNVVESVNVSSGNEQGNAAPSVTRKRSFTCMDDDDGCCLQPHRSTAACTCEVRGQQVRGQRRVRQHHHGGGGGGGRGQRSVVLDTNIRMETSEDEMSERQQTNGRTETAGGSDAGAVSKPRVRTPCPYGKDCYRKNPLHFRSAVNLETVTTKRRRRGRGEGEERPECPYGTD
ncbi:hypothetical protein INR49_020871 [Caranx melampygus]|nr:hypothetical protein INR49_020871 [Caranx melampygus]